MEEYTDENLDPKLVNSPKIKRRNKKTLDYLAQLSEQNRNGILSPSKSKIRDPLDDVSNKTFEFDDETDIYY